MAAKEIPIPITVGSQPNWNLRLGNPRLLNMFMGNNAIYCTPALQVLFATLTGIRAIYYTIYQNGSYIIVTQNQILRAVSTGITGVIANITASGEAVKIDENLQNQITVVDGSAAYVIDQRASSFTTLSSTQGYLLIDCVAVVVINTYTILLSSNGTFQISSPNNALIYNNPLQEAQIESRLTKGVGLVSLDNNLYILGSTGVERWVSAATNDYSFPFTRDDDYRSDYGVLSAASIALGIDEVYFLSNKYVPVVISLDGARELVEPNKEAEFDASIGLGRTIGNYTNPQNAYGAYYSFNGVYFYHLTFLDEKISWVANVKLTKWFNSDDLIVSASQDTQVVATQIGLYQLSDIQIPGLVKHRVLVPPRMVAYQGKKPYRNRIKGFEARMVQGNYQPIGANENPVSQKLHLSLSKDGLTFGNIIPSPIGKTGERQAVTVWNCNYTCQEITPKLEYWGDLDLCIEEFVMFIM